MNKDKKRTPTHVSCLKVVLGTTILCINMNFFGLQSEMYAAECPDPSNDIIGKKTLPNREFELNW